MNKKLILALTAVLMIAVLATFSGCATTTTTGENDTTSLLTTIGFLVIIFVLFYFVMIRPQRKRQKQHEQMMSELKKGDRVVTAGGIYGTIESLNEDSVVLKIESGATIRIARGSVFVRREQ
jgi:preprotein translocase subunit YajC